MTSTDTTNAGRRAALHRDTADHLPPRAPRSSPPRRRISAVWRHPTWTLTSAPRCPAPRCWAFTANPPSWARIEGINQPLSCALGVPSSHRHSGHRPFPTDRRRTDEYEHPGSVPHGRFTVRRPARVRVYAPLPRRRRAADALPGRRATRRHAGGVLSRRTELGLLVPQDGCAR